MDELRTYRRLLPKLLDREGQHVLIVGERLIGVFPTFQEAVGAGYDFHGLKPFFVERIEAHEVVPYFPYPVVA